MRRRLCSVAVLLSAAAGATPADQLARAEGLLAKVQEEEAVQVLNALLAQPGLGAEQRAKANVLLGNARFNLQDEAGARTAFKAALDAKADAALPKQASPRTRALFDEVRAGWEKARAAPVPAPASVAPAAVKKEEGRPWLTGRRLVGLGVGGAGVAGAVAGGVLLSQAQGQYAQAKTAPIANEADRLYRAAVSTNTAGSVLLAVGITAAAAGAAVVLWPRSDERAVTLLVTPTSVGVAGRF